MYLHACAFWLWWGFHCWFYHQVLVPFLWSCSFWRSVVEWSPQTCLIAGLLCLIRLNSREYVWKFKGFLKFDHGLESLERPQCSRPCRKQQLRPCYAIGQSKPLLWPKEIWRAWKNACCCGVRWFVWWVLWKKTSLNCMITFVGAGGSFRTRCSLFDAIATIEMHINKEGMLQGSLLCYRCVVYNVLHACWYMFSLGVTQKLCLCICLIDRSIYWSIDLFTYLPVYPPIHLIFISLIMSITIYICRLL